MEAVADGPYELLGVEIVGWVTLNYFQCRKKLDEIVTAMQEEKMLVGSSLQEHLCD